MKLTPLDIKRHQFEKGFRGYDPDEVDGFLKQVADRFEALQEEIRLAHERTRETEAKLQHYERVELALQEALESAKETAKRSQEDAERRAAVIVEEAELRAQKITHEAERERFGMRQDLIKLSARQAEVAARLRGFLTSELQIVADFQGDAPRGLLQLDDAPELLLDAPADPGPADLGVTPDTARETDTDGDAPVRTIGTVAGADLAPSSAEDAIEEADWSDLGDERPDPDDAPEADLLEETLPEAGLQADQPEADVESEDSSFAPSVQDAPATTGGDSDPVIVSSDSLVDGELSSPESEVLGSARPVETKRVAPTMPADPWTIPPPNVAGSEAERERIRRILEDLD